jgi:hypothetical protein
LGFLQKIFFGVTGERADHKNSEKNRCQDSFVLHASSQYYYLSFFREKQGFDRIIPLREIMVGKDDFG